MAVGTVMSLTYLNAFTTIFRYIILGALYFMVFYYLKNVSLQFIMYMVSLILQFFVIIFACKDIFSTTQLTKAMFDQYSENDPVEERNPLAKFMVFITVLLILLPIASLGMVLAVFDYAKKTTNDYSTYTLTKENEELMSLFQKIYRDYIMYLVILVYFIIFAHTKGTSKMMMFNIGCAALIIIVTGLAGYNIYLAAQFLKVKKSKQQLYQ